jgi:hypothetical protein
MLLLAVGVFVYVGHNTNSIVENAIETIGAQYLGAPVKVKDVEIALRRKDYGSIRISSSPKRRYVCATR